MNVLVWLRRDLRIADHPALARAAALGPVLPVFVADPADWTMPEAAGRHWAFVSECLAGLRQDLTGIGAPLVVRAGPAETVLPALIRAHRIGFVVSHALPGAPGSARLRARLAEAGAGWDELPDATAGGPPLDPPALQAVTGAEPGIIPTPAALRLAPDRCPHRQTGGRAAGLALLEAFLASRGEGYRAAQRAPGSGERAGSRLSSHLAWGSLSPREVEAAVAARLAERPGGGWPASLARFRASLAARETALARHDGHPGTSLPADRILAAWIAGETGLPFLDAAMRYLAATGWLDLRMRRMVAGVAVAQLGLSWQKAGTALARRLTDHDPAILWPQMRAIAGMDGRPAHVPDPVAQGLAQDPGGAFLRAWLPELAPVPDQWLHRPWRWPGAAGLLGRRYPEPLVDPWAAGRAARSRPPRPASPPKRRPVAGQLSFGF